MDYISDKDNPAILRQTRLIKCMLTVRKVTASGSDSWNPGTPIILPLFWNSKEAGLSTSQSPTLTESITCPRFLRSEEAGPGTSRSNSACTPPPCLCLAQAELRSVGPSRLRRSVARNVSVTIRRL
eukprot:926951-Amphidinium_carterae.1